uniref:RNA helicase n=1 Tax=Globodera pallida TaxID=36090 RepID=A0A183BNT6_GLOPA
MLQGAEWIEWMRSQGVQVESHLRLFTDEAVRHMTDDEFDKLRLKYIEPKPFADRAQYLWPGVDTTISEWLAHDWAKCGGHAWGDTSWDMAACQRHMLSLCANLRAETISTVRHQLENLKEYVTPPVDHVEKVNRPVNNEFVEAIKMCMSEIQRSMQVELQRIVEQKQLSFIGKDDIVFPNLDNQAQYQNRVGLLKKYLQHLEEPVTRVFLLRSINHLSHYFHAITISDLLPNCFALDYLHKKMSDYAKLSDNDQFNQVNAILLRRYEELSQQLHDIERSESAEKEQKKRAALLSTGSTNKYLFNMEKKEILNRLYRILFEQFANKSDSRALIFVATRACAQRLAKHLMELESELPMFYQMKNVGYMVSSNQSGSMGGQSSDEQRLMREGFSKGTIKVLVVTSVAEEGVNIAACNLIIKYNNVGSERQMIQRRGRARHKNSKTILLALDTGVELQEFSNMRKEAMMMRCIEDMQEQEEQTLRKKIEEKTKEMNVIRNEEKKKTESKREQLMGRRFNLKCTCGTLICCSDRVRSVMGTLFVCCDPEVWKRSKHTLTRSPTKEIFYTNCARWLCANCGEHWGQIVNYSNVFLPEIRVRAFVMERVDQQRGELDRSERIGKKWKDIEQSSFNIDAISMADIRSMYKSLLETNPEAHKEYEKQSRQADQLVAEKMAEKELLRGRERKERLFLEE